MWSILDIILVIAVIFLFLKCDRLHRDIMILRRQLGLKDAPTPQEQYGFDTTQEPETKKAETSEPESKPQQPWEAGDPESVEHLIQKTPLSGAMALLTRGNLLAKVGVVVLFFGIVFLLQYASSHDMISLNLRLLGASIFAVVLLVLGWWIQRYRQDYGIILQGCGLGILYILAYISHHYYTMISAETAFGFFIALSVLTAAIAVIQSTPTLVILAQVGGFLAPILASTGSNDVVVLFSYYAILNIIIAIIASVKSWRQLNLVGFVFTFIVATIWGIRDYQPQDYSIAQGFLIGFIVLYTFISLSPNRQHKDRLYRQIDLVLVYGVPLLGYCLQWSLVMANTLSLIQSALGFALFYIAINIGLVFSAKPQWQYARQHYMNVTLLLLATAALLSSNLTIIPNLWLLTLLTLIAIAGQYYVLFRQDKVTAKTYHNAWHHALLYWLLLWQAANLVAPCLYQHGLYNDAWGAFVLGAIPVIMGLLALKGATLLKWPMQKHASLYQGWIALPVMALLYIWTLIANIGLWPLPQTFDYWPILNPVDGIMILSGLLMLYWSRQQHQWLLKQNPSATGVISVGLGFWAFILITAIVARCVHYWTGTAYLFDDLYQSTTLQTTLTIVWSLLGLSLIWIATRRNMKALWLTAAAILILVVIKLFFIDLSNVNTIARIVSFIGVGLALLLIGYFSPMIPKDKS